MKTTTVLMLALCSTALLAGCKSDKTVGLSPATPAKSHEPVIADGSLMTPGTPKITPLSKPVTGPGQIIALEWNMFWGENGHDWTIYVDGTKLSSGKLPLNSPQSQAGQLAVELDQPGKHVVKVSLCNDHGCTESPPLEIQVPTAS